jgi:hypothetical protein
VVAGAQTSPWGSRREPERPGVATVHGHVTTVHGHVTVPACLRPCSYLACAALGSASGRPGLTVRLTAVLVAVGPRSDERVSRGRTALREARDEVQSTTRHEPRCAIRLVPPAGRPTSLLC